MAIAIRKLLPHDHDEVLALLADSRPQKSAPASPQELSKRTDLSLVARDNGKVVAAALCVPVEGGYQYEVAVTKSHRDTPLIRQIVDKVLLKLLAVGVGRCNIQIIERNSENEFWESAVWVATDV